MRRTPTPARSPTLERLIAVLAVTMLSLPSCAGAPTGPVIAPGTSARVEGVAEGDTWVTLAERGARMRLPQGWRYAGKDGGLVARAADKRAALVLAGATSRQDLDRALRGVGAGFELDLVKYPRGRSRNLHGIPVEVYEDMAATTSGEPADVTVVLGDAPNGRGVVFVVIVASDATVAHDPAIIAATNSLQPL